MMTITYMLLPGIFMYSDPSVFMYDLTTQCERDYSKHNGSNWRFIVLLNVVGK